MLELLLQDLLYFFLNTCFQKQFFTHIIANSLNIPRYYKNYGKDSHFTMSFQDTHSIQIAQRPPL